MINKLLLAFKVMQVLIYEKDGDEAERLTHDILTDNEELQQTFLDGAEAAANAGTRVAPGGRTAENVITAMDSSLADTAVKAFRFLKS